MDFSTKFAKADQLYDDGKHEEAFEEFLALAEYGDVSAMTRVAFMYYQGEGVDPSLEQSIAWDKKAAELGDCIAMSNLASTYRCKGDIREAKKWFERSLESGNGEAALSLAKMYLVSDKEIDRIRSYLLQAIAHKNIYEGSIEEAKTILAEISHMLSSE